MFTSNRYRQEEGTAGVTSTGGAGRGNGAGCATAQEHSSGEPPSRQPRHGRVVGDVWEKMARASKGQLRNPQGWAADMADLKAAEAYGAELLHVHDLENARHYWACLALLRRHGFPLDRGFGPQVGLDLGWWRPTRDAAEALAAQDAMPPEPEPGAPIQLGLFGVGVAYGR